MEDVRESWVKYAYRMVYLLCRVCLRDLLKEVADAPNMDPDLLLDVYEVVMQRTGMQPAAIMETSCLRTAFLGSMRWRCPTSTRLQAT